MPNRASIYVVLFIVLFNGGYVMMDGLGVWDHMGTDPQPGGSDIREDVVDSTDPSNIDPQGGGLGTLFGLITVIYHGTVGAALDTILPGLAMLNNLAIVPGPVVEFLQLVSFVAGIDAAAYLRGFNL